MVQYTKKFWDSLVGSKEQFSRLVTWCGMLAEKAKNGCGCGTPSVHVDDGKYGFLAVEFAEKFFEIFSREIGIPAPVKSDEQSDREGGIVISSGRQIGGYGSSADDCDEDLLLFLKGDANDDLPGEELVAAMEKEFPDFVKIARNVYNFRLREKELGAKCRISRAAVDAMFEGNSYEHGVFYWWLAAVLANDKTKEKNSVWIALNERNDARCGFAETLKNTVIADFCATCGVRLMGDEISVSNQKNAGFREQCSALLANAKTENAAVFLTLRGEYKCACDAMSNLWRQTVDKIRPILLVAKSDSGLKFGNVIRWCAGFDDFCRRVLAESENFKRYAVAHYEKTKLLNSL